MSDGQRVEAAYIAIHQTIGPSPNLSFQEAERLSWQAARATIAALDDARDAEIARLREALEEAARILRIPHELGDQDDKLRALGGVVGTALQGGNDD